jgi:hypothetical protein
MAKEEEPGDPSTIAAAEGKEDLYLYNGPINEVGYLELIRAVSDPHHAKKAILLITTYGGSAESGYKIARWFQRFYEEFWLYPTSVCASAGTLIAMGAHGLYMSPFSELGPLDVQLAKRNELGEYKSGLVTKAALEKLRDEALRFWENFMLEIKRKGGRNITFDTCANIATAVCSAVFGELYKKIEPEILGQDDRDLKVAQEYGNRLARRGGNITEESILRLVHDYPSHDFVIDSEESETLFNKVELPSNSLMQVALSLAGRAFGTSRTKVDTARLASAPSEITSETPKGKDDDQSPSPDASQSN